MLLAELQRNGWASCALWSQRTGRAPFTPRWHARIRSCVLAGRSGGGPSPGPIPRPPGPRPRLGLSDREVEVLRHVAEGRASRDVGEAMGLSALTIKSHLGRISRKLGTGDRAGMRRPPPCAAGRSTNWRPSTPTAPTVGELAGQLRPASLLAAARKECCAIGWAPDVSATVRGHTVWRVEVAAEHPEGRAPVPLFEPAEGLPVGSRTIARSLADASGGVGGEQRPNCNGCRTCLRLSLRATRVPDPAAAGRFRHRALIDPIACPRPRAA